MIRYLLFAVFACNHGALSLLTFEEFFSVSNLGPPERKHFPILLSLNFILNATVRSVCNEYSAHEKLCQSFYGDVPLVLGSIFNIVSQLDPSVKFNNYVLI